MGYLRAKSYSSQHLRDRQFKNEPIKEIKEPKPKEKRKIKTVYFDDILMETLNITRKIQRKKNIFKLARRCVFEAIDGRLMAFPGHREFTQRLTVDLVTHHYIGGLREFDLLKKEKDLEARGMSLRPRNDNHYNYGMFLNPTKRKGRGNGSLSKVSNSFNERKTHRASESKARRKKKRKRPRDKRKISPVLKETREKKGEQICDICGKKFEGFFKFLGHIKSVHQTNVEEIL